MKIKVRLITLICLICMLFSSLVYADGVSAVSEVGAGSSVLKDICSDAKDMYGVQILSYDSSTGLLKFQNGLYSELTTTEKRVYMEYILQRIKEAKLESRLKTKSYNFVAEQDTAISSSIKLLKSDTSADFARAEKWFRPFGSVAGVVIGVLCLFIFGFIGLSIAIDVAYITLPGARLLLEYLGSIKRDGLKFHRDTSGGSRRPHWVSIEAYRAVIDVESEIGSGSHKSVVGEYMKDRVPSIMLMSIALGYLISGQLYDFVGWIIDSFVWIF